MHYIADAIKEKVTGIVVGKPFMSILSDPSKARKTKEEKELVLVQIELSCVPVYYVVFVLEMAALGDALPKSLKKFSSGKCRFLNNSQKLTPH